MSGSLPSSNGDRLAQAGQLMNEGKAVEAIKLYDQILKDDPRQPVALAYRGWLVRLAGLKDEGLAYVDRAVAADPSYPDAHFFRGMMLWQDKADPAAAVAEFRLFLANGPPQAMVALVEDALRARRAGGRHLSEVNGRRKVSLYPSAMVPYLFRPDARRGWGLASPLYPVSAGRAEVGVVRPAGPGRHAV